MSASFPETTTRRSCCQSSCTNMQRTVLALLLLAAFSYSVHAQSAGAALSSNGFKLFSSVVKCAGADKAAADAKLKVTVLAPTDSAVTAFLSQMGMTAAELLKNDGLCKAVLASHVVPAVLLSSAAKDDPTPVPTLQRGSTMYVAKEGRRVFITDTQGNTAYVDRADIKAGASIIHGINRVLRGGHVFDSPAAALNYYGKSWSTLMAAITRAGQLPTLTAAGFAGTVLAPSNRAFAKVPTALTMPRGQLRDVLAYHVLPKARSIPQGFTSGRSYPTLLQGQTVKYTLATRQAPTAAGVRRTLGTATFTSTSGNSATVVGPNIFAGKAVFHAINAVLMPGKGVTAGRRHLMQRRGNGGISGMGQGQPGNTGRGSGGGGESADAMSMAQQSNYDAQQEAIQWAATSGVPGSTEAAVQTGNAGNQAVGVTGLDESQW